MTRKYTPRVKVTIKCIVCDVEVLTGCVTRKYCKKCQKEQNAIDAKRTADMRDKKKKYRNSGYVSTDWLYC